MRDAMGHMMMPSLVAALLALSYGALLVMGGVVPRPLAALWQTTLLRALAGAYLFAVALLFLASWAP